MQNGKEKYKSTIDSLQNGSRMSVNYLQGKRGMSKTILCTEKWILLKKRNHRKEFETIEISFWCSKQES